jgi:uncharacterized protein (TIGR02246 family)
MMNRILIAISPILSAMLFACNTLGPVNEDALKSEIYKEMKASEAAWNEGSLEKFMDSYLRSDALRFAGKGSATYGWETVLAQYKKSYPDRAAMGKLTFSDIDVTVLGRDAAVVFGRWHLQIGEEEKSGLYTLLFRKTEDGWRIVHDHSSSAE